MRGLLVAMVLGGGLLAGGAATAFADTITITLTNTIWGTDQVTGAVYTDAPLVFSQTFTTADFEYCVTVGICTEGQPYYSDVLGTEQLSVNGILLTPGRAALTVVAVGNGVVVYDIEEHQGLAVYNDGVNTDFSHSTPLFTGTTFQPQQAPECVDDPYFIDCPSSFAGIILTQAGDTGTASVTVTPDVVTPEPGTWVMVGTGLLGGIGAVRRRLVR